MSSRPLALAESRLRRCGSLPALEGSQMAWAYLVGLALVLWGACGGVIAVGRRLWSLDTTLCVHLITAPIVAFLVAAAHKELAPGFDPLLRAAAITIIVMLRDALV